MTNPAQGSGGDTTCWDMIAMAAAGDAAQRAGFARRYSPVAARCLRARWRGTPLMDQIDDAVNEVFVECFRDGGVLHRADPDRSGGFRAYFAGVVFNVSRRFEMSRANRREVQPSTAFDADQQDIARDTSSSKALDRAWARAILDQAGDRYRRLALHQGEDALRRVELLRLRFQENLPVRAIAERWNADPAMVHQEYRRARREFRRCIEAELRFHGERWQDLDGGWKELVSLLE